MQINDHVGMVWCWRAKKKDAISKENVTNTYFLGQFALSKRVDVRRDPKRDIEIRYCRILGLDTL